MERPEDSAARLVRSALHHSRSGSLLDAAADLDQALAFGHRCPNRSRVMLEVSQARIQLGELSAATTLAEDALAAARAAGDEPVVMLALGNPRPDPCRRPMAEAPATSVDHPTRWQHAQLVLAVPCAIMQLSRQSCCGRIWVGADHAHCCTRTRTGGCGASSTTPSCSTPTATVAPYTDPGTRDLVQTKNGIWLRVLDLPR